MPNVRRRVRVSSPIKKIHTSASFSRSRIRRPQGPTSRWMRLRVVLFLCSAVLMLGIVVLCGALMMGTTWDGKARLNLLIISRDATVPYTAQFLSLGGEVQPSMSSVSIPQEIWKQVVASSSASPFSPEDTQRHIAYRWGGVAHAIVFIDRIEHDDGWRWIWKLSGVSLADRFRIWKYVVGLKSYQLRRIIPTGQEMTQIEAFDAVLSRASTQRPLWGDIAVQRAHVSLAVINTTQQVGFARSLGAVFEQIGFSVVHVSSANTSAPATRIVVTPTLPLQQSVLLRYIQRIFPTSVKIEEDKTITDQYRSDIVVFLAEDAQGFFSGKNPQE